MHPLREMLRDLPARRHPPGAHRGRHPEHAHAYVRFQRELLRLVHRGERRHTLELPAGATKENVIIGRAVINTDWCLAYKLIGCRFCYDTCPYEAIKLDDENRPVVLDNKCNGCGACESVCVSLQNGSISEGATSRAITIKPLDQVER